MKILKIIIIVFFIFYFVSLIIFLKTTNYSWDEVDDDHSGFISFSEIYKYFDTGKRYKCIITNHNIIYSNHFPSQKCKQIMIEYYNFKDGLEFKVIDLNESSFKIHLDKRKE